MFIEQIIFSQVVLIQRQIFFEEDENSPTTKLKYKISGKTPRSEHRFSIDNGCIETSFKAIAPEFYNRLFQKNIEGQ